MSYTLLNLNDTVFRVTVKNNCWAKKRVETTDADGNSWFRYDRPNYEYIVSQPKVIGRVFHTSEWVDQVLEEPQPTSYYLDDDSEWDETDIDRLDLHSSGIFTTLSLATAYIEKHKESVNA